MGTDTRRHISGMLLDNKRHMRYLAILACMALVVAFGVARSLKQNVRAMTHEETVLDCHYCGGGAHTHNADCYDADGNLVCPLPERALHTHDDSCYVTETHVVCGMEEGQELEDGSVHEHSDACYETTRTLVCGQEEVTEEHVHGAGCFKTVTVTEPEPEAESRQAEEADAAAETSEPVTRAEDAGPEYTAQTFEERVDLAGKKLDASDDLIVKVEAPEGALPKGTKMQVKAATTKKNVDSAKKEVEGKLNVEVEDVQAVDITFIYEGKEIEPKKNVHVSMRYENVEYTQGSALEIVHVDDKYNAEIVGKKNEETKKDEVTFESDRFSVYALVISTQHISHNGYKYDVSVSYGPEAKIPDGSWLSVTDIPEGTSEYDYARNAVLADKLAKGESVNLQEFRLAALDISIIDPNGNEIEPSAEVKVDLKVKSLPEVERLGEVVDSIEVQHHVETSNGVIVETVAGGKADASFNLETDAKIIASNRQSVVDPNSVSEYNYRFQHAEQGEIAETSFGVEVFSTYTISWGQGWGAQSYTVHYVDSNGNSVTPNRTPTFTNGYNFLIYDVEGYEYDSTHLGSLNGTVIRPLLRWSNNTKQYRNANNNNWNNLTTDIYVVYRQKTNTMGGTPQVDTEETWPEGDDAPQFGKSSKSNGNGTNTISLSIAAAEKQVEKSTPADVIVVFDVSGSMGDDMNGQTRLQRAKTAVNTMANTLLNGSNSDVRMALVSFSTTATSVQGFTNSYNIYSGRVNNLSADGGTNWEQALQLANNMEVRANAATFVVFVTDGDPTFRVSRGNVSDNNLDMWTGSTYQYYRSNSVFGEGNNDSQGRNFSFAVEQVKAIAGANKSFYAIGISDDVTKVQNLTTQGGVAADHAFIASNSTAMENAFKSITESIKSVLGFGNVKVTDGITSLTNAEMKVMQTVDPNSFTYYRYGGENNKFGSDYDHKRQWTTREADGCAPATYNEEKGAVEWNMGSSFQLEDGVTYVVEFTVWPSQDAYDLVADLNNGIKTYATLTEAQKAQVVEVTAPTGTTTGTYALKTNTNEVNATYNKTTKSGDVVSVSDNTEMDARYTEGTLENMSLASSYITVKKVWNNHLDAREATGVDLTVTKDELEYITGITVSGENDWTSGKEYISAGVITKTVGGLYNVRESGHDYTVTEPASFSYYWDLSADVYRPMVIDGVLHVLIKTDSPTGTEGSDYYVIGGSNYQVRDGQNSLTATNDRRSFLNLNKVVTQDQGSDDVPDSDAFFGYTLTVTDVNGADVWFQAQDASGSVMEIANLSPNVVAEMGDDGTLTGYYHVPSGQQFTIGIKANWNVRFINLPTGTTYSIQETGKGIDEGFEFVGAAATADNGGTPASVSSDTVTGTIDKPNNDFRVTYTNKWTTQDFNIRKVDDKGVKLKGATFELAKGRDKVSGFEADTLKNTGEVSGIKLGKGVYCLTEVAAPDGYNILSNKVYFAIQKAADGYVAVACDENGETDGVELQNIEIVDNGLTIQVSNTPGQALPMTGGHGTALFNIFGTAIATAAILTYGLLSRRTSGRRSRI